MLKFCIFTGPKYSLTLVNTFKAVLGFTAKEEDPFKVFGTLNDILAKIF